jgi:hypothetical protein
MTAADGWSWGLAGSPGQPAAGLFGFSLPFGERGLKALLVRWAWTDRAGVVVHLGGSLSDGDGADGGVHPNVAISLAA